VKNDTKLVLGFGTTTVVVLTAVYALVKLSRIASAVDELVSLARQ